VKFCSRCGAQFPDMPPAAAPAEKVGVGSVFSSIVGMFKAMPLKKILLIAIPVIVVIIAAIIFIPMLSGSSVAMETDSIAVFVDNDQLFISGNTNNRFAIDGKFESIQRNMDGGKAAILTDYDSRNGGTLWFVTTSNSYHIADDVLEYILSDTGNGIAYLTDYDSRNDVATLYLVETSSRKSTLITEEAMYDGSMQGICISPNGKSIAYISDYDERDNEFTGYMKIDGKGAEKIGSNLFAVALADGGRYLYYVKLADNGTSLHVRSGRSDNRLVSDYRGLSSLSLKLNRDYSQVIFNDGDRSYIAQSGGEKVRIGGTPIRWFLLPTWAQQGGNHRYVNVYGLRNFANNVIRNDDGLAYLNSAFETNRISSTADNSYSAIISNDGKTLLFLNNNGHLSAIDPTKAGAERREIARDVETFLASSNGKTIYYINDEDELYCVKGNGNPVKVSDDVYAYSLQMPINSNRAFFLVDYRRGSGELCFSNNGSKRTKVAGGDDVVGVMALPKAVYYLTIDEDIFRSNGNERFSLFVEEVNSYY